MSTGETETRFEQFRAQLAGLGRKIGDDGLSDEQRVERAKRVFRKRTDTATAIGLESCIHCGMCAEVCHFYTATREPKYAPVRKYELLRRVYRRELSPMRWLYRVFERDISADDLRDWQELVYDACTACGRCDMICPMGIGISESVRVVREGLAAAGLVPDEMRALDEEQRDKGSLFGVDAAMLKEIAGQLDRQGIEVPLDREQADVMVLSSALNLKLFPESLAATAKIMNHLGVNWTIRTAAFDANNYGYLTGNHEAQQIETRRIVEAAGACGATTVVVPECGHAYPALRWEGANEMSGPLPFDVLSIAEFVGREIGAGRLRLRSNGRNKAVAFHDPCRMGRHGGVFDEPRLTLQEMGVEVRELEYHRRANICCGGGEGVNWIGRAARLRQKAFEIKREEIEKTGADSLVTSCDSCRYNFITGGEKANWNMPVESLVEMVADSLETGTK